MRAMLSGRRGTALAAIVILGLVGSCARNPQFRMTNANLVYNSLGDLYVLLAQAELGAFASPSSYGKAVESYASVMGGFEIGRLLATGRPGEAGSLDQVIAACVGEVKELAEMHRRVGVLPDAAVIETVRTWCDRAAAAAAEQEVSSWLFETAASDL
jgi:hypothetical protein